MIHWPTTNSVQDYLCSCCDNVSDVRRSDSCLIFDFNLHCSIAIDFTGSITINHDDSVPYNGKVFCPLGILQ